MILRKRTPVSLMADRLIINQIAKPQSIIKIKNHFISILPIPPLTVGIGSLSEFSKRSATSDAVFKSSEARKPLTDFNTQTLSA